MAEQTRVSARINGAPVEFLCYPHQSLLECLRDVLELTGTKEGCNDGNCAGMGRGPHRNYGIYYPRDKAFLKVMKGLQINPLRLVPALSEAFLYSCLPLSIKLLENEMHLFDI